MALPTDVLFYFPWREVSGGPVYLSRLANALSHVKGINVYYCDYIDGFAIDKLGSKVHRVYIDENDFSPYLNFPLTIITPIYFAPWLPKLHPDSKVLFFNWHISSIPVLKVNGAFSDRNLKVFLDLVGELRSCFYLDKSHYLEHKKYTKKSFPDYVPISVGKKTELEPLTLVADNQISFGVLSRLVIDKIYGIYNLIDNFKNLKTTKNKILHIIGDGPYRKELENYDFGDVKLVLHGIVVGDELTSLVRSKIDVMFSMGTSILDCGAMCVPSVIIPHNMKKIKSNSYVWLHNTADYCLGWYDTQLKELEVPVLKLESIYNQIYVNDDKKSISVKCRDYSLSNHSDIFAVNQLCEKLLSCSLHYYELDQFKFDGNPRTKSSKLTFLGIPVVQTGSSDIDGYRKLFFLGIPVAYYKNLGNKRKFLFEPIVFLLKLRTYLANVLHRLLSRMHTPNVHNLNYDFEILRRFVAYANGPSIVMMDTCDNIISKAELNKIANISFKQLKKVFDKCDKRSIETLERIIDRTGRYVRSGDGYFSETMWEYEEYTRIMDTHNSNIVLFKDGMAKWGNYFLPKQIFCTSVLFNKCYIPEIGNLNYYKGKVFIDVGAHIGDSSLVLSEFTLNDVYAFEPSVKNYKQLKKTIKMNSAKKIIPVNKALGDKAGFVSFSENDDCSHIVDDGSDNIKVEVTTIDNFCMEHRLAVGLIKMDVEGFESKVISGAINVIKKYKPALLISIYHNYNDLLYMKSKIDNLNLGYVFKIRKPADRSVLTDTILICDQL